MDDFDKGWDARAILVDGAYVERTPRRPEVEAPMRREVVLMPWLAPQLPLPVALPAITSEHPLTLRHSLIVGDACPGTNPRHGSALGTFLRALHGIDVVEAQAHGAWDAASAHEQVREVVARSLDEVLPLLPAHLQDKGVAMLGRIARQPDQLCLIHADLGPEHIRVLGDRVGGVIDWLDARIGDPALDLSWVLHGTSRAFAQAVRDAYRPSDDVLARAGDWHLLGPWHEVIYGIDTATQEYVDSGLDGVVTRLTATRRT